MPEHDQASRDQDKTQSADDHAPQGDALPKFSPVRLRLILATGGVLLAGLLLASIFIPHMAERVKFFTGNALNVLLLAVIVIQVYINQRQWEAMDKQLDSMSKQVELAGKQLDTLAIGERAYVGVKDMTLASPLAVGCYPRVRIIFENGGRTPAWGFVSGMRIIKTVLPVEEAAAQFPVSAELWANNEAGSFLPAGAVRRVEYPNTSMFITGEEYAAIHARVVKLYVIVEARYRDFQGNEQALSYRVMYDPDDGGFSETE